MFGSFSSKETQCTTEKQSKSKQSKAKQSKFRLKGTNQQTSHRFD